MISLSLSAALSGTHQAALSAAGRISRPGQVTVVDSCSASVGQGLIVLCAVEHARAGLDRDARYSPRYTTASDAPVPTHWFPDLG